MTTDPTSTADLMMGLGGGGAGTGIVGYALYRLFGKQDGGGSFERLEGKMDQMIEAQQDGNLILAEIKGALGSRTG
jgi:hypothetical protein